ncbi:hypothetical protein P3342_012740 [Pyrenophora teres f. teres]|nr:hypothetical protein P3342_012740 [Pyrenophora teres f. teres]
MVGVRASLSMDRVSIGLIADEDATDLGLLARVTDTLLAIPLFALLTDTLLATPTVAFVVAVAVGSSFFAAAAAALLA